MNLAFNHLIFLTSYFGPLFSDFGVAFRYWDVVWSPPQSIGTKGTLERLAGTSCEVIVETEDQVELSFSRTWDPSLYGKLVPLKIDKRFYSYQRDDNFNKNVMYDHHFVQSIDHGSILDIFCFVDHQDSTRTRFMNI